MASSKTIELLDGAKVPWLGWGNGSGKARKDPIRHGKVALNAGIDHLDTAQGYNNEKESGETIRESGLSRDKVWVTSKLSLKDGGTDTSPPIEPADVRTKVQETIDRLGFTPDLFLVHNPFVFPKGKILEGWQALEALKDEGILKSIGVSNFRPQDLETVLNGCKHKPTVNQLEFHPYVLSHIKPILDIQEKEGIVTASYGPLTPLLRHPSKNGGPLKPVLTKIAERYTKSEGTHVDKAAILLLWCRAKNVIAITTSGNDEHIKETAKIYSLPALPKEDVDEIDAVGSKYYVRGYDEHMTVDFPEPKLPAE